MIFEFEAPPGIRYPQHAPGIDSFDEKDRISKLAEELKAKQIAELDAGRKDKAELADQILDRQRAAKRVRTTEFTDGEIEAAFKFIDLDHNGYVGAAEIRHVLVCMGELITDEEVDMMIKMVDSDGDGQVSFTEFYNVVTDPDPAHTDFVKMAVRSRRPAVLRRLHAIDAHRLQERMSWVVYFSILRPFDAPRRLSLEAHSDAQALVARLKAEGRIVAATDLSPGAVDFGAVDWKDGRHALVFGNEEVGISEELRELADVRVRLPMRGLAESLNLSVSVGAALAHVDAKGALVPDLSVEERDLLLLRWSLLSVRAGRELLRREGVVLDQGVLKTRASVLGYTT